MKKFRSRPWPTVVAILIRAFGLWEWKEQEVEGVKKQVLDESAALAHLKRTKAGRDIYALYRHYRDDPAERNAFVRDYGKMQYDRYKRATASEGEKRDVLSAERFVTVTDQLLKRLLALDPSERPEPIPGFAGHGRAAIEAELRLRAQGPGPQPAVEKADRPGAIRGC